jgi:hypothetical protein
MGISNLNLLRGTDASIAENTVSLAQVGSIVLLHLVMLSKRRL